MANLEQIISEQNESSYLDFKTIQYRREKYEDFIIDIIAMANAETKNSKYIVIGIKAHPDGKKEFIGITDQFIDEATYQQLIQENVEPEIKIDYFSLEMNSKIFGIFHISECNNPPYMLKKDYGKLKRGDGFIRKGSHQTRITRKDIDKFLVAAVQNSKRIDDIQITSLVNNSRETEIRIVDNILLPSEVAAKEILETIQDKEKYPGGFLVNTSFPHFGGTSYRDRTLDTLKENLKNVSSDYREDDLYHLFEERSYKLNFELLNIGSVYLEDASIQVEIESKEGLSIPKRVFPKPDNRDLITRMSNPLAHINTDNLDYPSVTQKGYIYEIFENIGNIKHQISCDAFKTPIRILITDKYKPECLEFKIKIFGKNLERPMEKNLALKIVR